MRSTIIIVDTSYLKDIDSILSKKVVENIDLEKTCLTRLCNSLKRNAKMVYVDSHNKRERKVLSKDLKELLYYLINLCDIRLSFFKRRMVDVDYIEDVVNRICRENRWVRTVAISFAERFANVDNICEKHSDNVFEQIVDRDLHIVITSLHYMINCGDIEVFTSDHKLIDIINVANNHIIQYDNDHRLGVSTTNCLQ